MNTATRPLTAPADSDSTYYPPTSALKSIAWEAIFAGLVAAIALEVLFMMLGAGLGFAIYSPITDSNPIESLGAGAMIIQGISAVLSLWFGGWVAGRVAPAARRRTAWLHGFMVWCAATVAGVIFVASGAGWTTGNLSQIIGGGLSGAGQTAAAAVSKTSDMAKDALSRTDAATASFTEEALGRRTDTHSPADTVKAKREVGMAVTRLFNPSQAGNRAANQAATTRALVDNAGMNENDANRLVGEWITSYDHLKEELAAAKNDAEAKAQQVAQQAAKALSIISLCGFAGFLMGALAASFGARQGAIAASKWSTGDEFSSPPLQP